ncbi:MAG: RNA methyltransferase [Oscillospiraceae bacterium]|nr:RNA methyltransferase [Oscillospiraceae bacterium]
MAERITSRANPLCTHFRKLASSRTYRQETGEFLCDSPKLLSEAQLWGAAIKTVLYTEGAKLPSFDDAGVRMVEVSKSVMCAVSPMETPQGVVFSCGLPQNAPPERVEPGRYLVLDGIQDPGNVGTILRTADAFDCGGIFLLPGCADLYNPKTLRAAMGVHFRRALYLCTLEELTALLTAAAVPLYAAALRENTVDVREADLSNAAIVIGSEGRGVSPQVLAACGKTLKIPMSKRCESLNAAAAAAVLLWEGWR